MRLTLLTIVPVVLLAGCAAESRTPPISLAPTQASGPPDTMPQSPNSLPPGSQVQSPFTPAAGDVNNVRVGPGSPTAPVTSTTPPIAGTGTGTATGRPNRVTNGY